MTASEIRERYTRFFANNGHTLLASSDIVPKSDSTLLFTNAGMVPFKQFFLNPTSAPYKMVTSVQKCVRAGGKHNDLDQVGYTPRHHTFFEMLGNFSFGAYGKREIIQMAWRFVTEELQMPAKMLRVTVLESDDESYNIWKNEIGIDPKRIVRCGAEDNFWSMGSGEGPCGPSSEIFWDTQDPRYSENDEERWLEFWNLVFMQYHRTADGELKQLATPCIDTGMGLERVASILQGKKNNFDTDIFQNIIDGIEHSASVAASTSPDKLLTYKRIIADHLRASAFLIAEGVYPSNTGRGYVLRRIIRRAVRAGRLLGINSGVLSGLYPSLESAMGAAYPEIVERRKPIVSVLESEEKAFLKTLDKGMALLEDIFASGSESNSRVISGKDVFLLYDTHGFPVDLTEIIARDHGWGVDVAAFDRIQHESRERNRASWKGGSSKKDTVAGEIESACLEWQDAMVQSRFCGYDIDPESKQASVTAKVAAFRELSNGDALAVIDPCPFYATGGGQQADTGKIAVTRGSDTHEFAVKTAVALPNGKATVLHLTGAGSKHALFDAGQEVTGTIDMHRRYGNAVHHTATHLLNAALRRVVGDSVMQAGSLVQPDGLRFDFTSAPLTSSQLEKIEDLVNGAALDNTSLCVHQMSLEQAKTQGAMAMFTEKYDTENVRVVEVPGVSMELCGGTHLHTTRAVFPFQIISEGSIGSGTRRIEAVAGVSAARWLQRQLGHARAAAQTLEAKSLDGMGKKAQQLVEKNKALKDEVATWLQTAAVNVEAIATRATCLGKENVPTVVHLLPLLACSPAVSSAKTAQHSGGDARLVAERARFLRDAQPHSAHVVIQGCAVALSVDTECVSGAKAKELLRDLFAILPGKGGGQDTLAQGKLASAVTALDQLTCIK
ncbi:hypothetical protein LPJ75_001095 [Coemansia sp. RSA 2598]|nr:hypothetical protein LPJ75_001095 [Coemansia sp. RSA 2598]